MLLTPVESRAWNAQLSCSNCGRWVDAGGVKGGKATKDSSNLDQNKDDLHRPSNDDLTGSTTQMTESERYQMTKDVEKRELMPLAWHSYCTNCSGLVCSICVSVSLDAMACPQCLTLYQVTSSNPLSSTSQLTLGLGSKSSVSSGPSPSISPSPSSIFSSSNASPSLSTQASTPSLLPVTPTPLLASNASLSTALFNRCKKCNSCPSCSSPALGVRSLALKEAPESLLFLFQSSNQPPASPSPLSSNIGLGTSTSTLNSIAFYSCSFCRWSSLDSLTQSPSSSSSSSSLSPVSSVLYSDMAAKLIAKSLQIERDRTDKASFQSLVEQRRKAFDQKQTSSKHTETSFSTSTMAETSSLTTASPSKPHLASPSALGLLGSAKRTRSSSSAGHSRRQSLGAGVSGIPTSSPSRQKTHRRRISSGDTHDHSVDASQQQQQPTTHSPLINLMAAKRTSLEDRLNHPIQHKYKHRETLLSSSSVDNNSNNTNDTINSTNDTSSNTLSSNNGLLDNLTIPVSYTDQEKLGLEKELSILDESWRSLQNDPLLYFRPLPRDPLAPLQYHLMEYQHHHHSDRQATSTTVSGGSISSSSSPFPPIFNPSSPISSLSSLSSTINQPSSTSQHTPSQVQHPERIPLLPICSKRCMKCERLLVKPTCDGSSLSGGGVSAAVGAGDSGSNSFSALPDFKRRHSALSFSPIVEVVAANAYDDYKPSLILDEWNIMQITIFNPSLLPAIHLSLSSDSQKKIDDPSSDLQDSDAHITESNDSDQPSRSTSTPGISSPPPQSSSSLAVSPTPSSKGKSFPGSPRLETDSKGEGDEKRSLPTSMCQVDCNGCDTWVLEDEPINLDDEEGAEPSEASWMTQPGVPSHLQLLEADSDNPAISGRKSRQVTMVLMVMPDSKVYKQVKEEAKSISLFSTSSSHGSSTSSSQHSSPPIICQLSLKISWPSPTATNAEHSNELISPLRINLSNIFDPPVE